MSNQPLIRMECVSHVYGKGGHNVQALKEISLSVEAGEFIAITGPSGSGKSTLLHIAGCLLKPTSGSYRLDDMELTRLGENHLARIRNETFGFVFQKFSLLPRLNALQNVALPLMYAGAGKGIRHARATRLLTQVGLEDRISHFPNELSGGEQQRVSIARALANTPRILFADEPTGNLDSATGGLIMDMFETCVAEGMTVFIVTHEPQAVKRASRTIQLLDSRIV